MKPILIPMVLMLATCCAIAQGTLVYDQQSATNPPGGFQAFQTQTANSIGQTFVPNLSSVDFFQLYLHDSSFNNGVGATVSINLWLGSSTNGLFLGSTVPVFMPDNFTGSTNFLFGSAIGLTSGTTYFLQPVVQSGEATWYEGLVSGFVYPGGTALLNNVPQPGFDLWFREGIVVVPEPTIISFALLGAVGIYLGRRKT